MNEFTQVMAEAMQKKVSEGIQFESSEAVRMNYVGPCIRSRYEDGSNLGPVIYPQGYYDRYARGESMDELAEEAVRTVEEAHRNTPELDLSMIDADYVREHGYLDIVNAEQNRELLASCANVRKLDLAGVPKVSLNVSGDVSGSILIKRGFQREILRMTDEELLFACLKNTREQEVSVMGMNEQLMGALQAHDAPDGIEPLGMSEKEIMYVVTNRERYGGASVLFCPQALDEACRKAGMDETFIIPSSRHEIIMVDQEMQDDPAFLHASCIEVNRTQVSQNDYLSDNIYHYDANTHSLDICNSLEELQEIRERLAMSEKLEVVHTAARMRR